MEDKDLKRAILSEPLVSRVFNAGIEIYMVGGYLRDILCGIRSRDMDFVVNGDVDMLIKDIFSDVDRTVVGFKNADLIRVVAGGITLDFSELKVKLEDDLFRRDFTMNAVAWSPETGIIDPLNGAVDIKNSRIRAISEKNFIADPLRLFRAYRFAGELGWVIERDTRKMIRGFKTLIKRPATERVTLEFFKLLNSFFHVSALKTAFSDGLLTEILSIDNRQLVENIKAVSRLSLFLEEVPEAYKFDFHRPFSQGISYIGLLRAEQILYSSNYSKNRLRISRAILKRLGLTEDALKRCKGIRNLTGKQLFDLFEDAGDAAMDFAILTRRKRLIDEAKRFLNIKPVLPAEQIINITGARGPEIGRLIREMLCLQFIGKINKEEDAVAWLTIV